MVVQEWTPWRAKVNW